PRPPRRAARRTPRPAGPPPAPPAAPRPRRTAGPAPRPSAAHRPPGAPTAATPRARGRDRRPARAPPVPPLWTLHCGQSDRRCRPRRSCHVRARRVGRRRRPAQPVRLGRILPTGEERRAQLQLLLHHAGQSPHTLPDPLRLGEAVRQAYLAPPGAVGVEADAGHVRPP